MTSPCHLRQNVLAWLDTLSSRPDPPSCRASFGRKRSKSRAPGFDAEQPSPKRRCHLTPPASTIMSASPTKRSHDKSNTPSAASSSVASSYRDDEQTPKSKKTKLVPEWGTLSATVSTRRSASVSPKKLAQNWAVRKAFSRQFTIKEDIPTSLKSMWRDIDRYDKGIGTIGLAEKDAVEAAQRTSPEYEQDIFESFFYEQEPQVGEGARSALGPTPSVASVLDIMERGISCRDEQMDEAGWNQIVHGQILELAFAGLWRKNDEIVVFSPCTSATIMSNYTDTVSRKVDFCVCIRPDALSSIAIQAIRDQDVMASVSINHTDFPPLQARPIALSIETKIHGEGLNNAEAQLVTWHAAQWRLLDRLVSRAEPKMQLPEFLPGIIIQGHDWSFVASTKQGDQVTLWTSQHIGSSAKVTGVYQIVCVLQYLKRWIENTYWPWFKQAVLRFSGDD
ncbi:uncharacterized protein LY79DRAFT_66909 [Colletotrichum navitas]|uniref:PD-(D/E)XK nuclease-like domain-containing protein n=1 Tax=Colletotrichum navitas TaxID=681940 RepID=A0AAD8UWU9_9PEZI|nr:uncharacterized protein LY79DRAFT_66909 [Colletotrichum navitas]KAK1569820.1 hypothetical protein LY79DRAFT_66909 [Colletotrichum navitas]